MRSKFVIAVLLLVFAILGTMVFMSRPARTGPGGGVPGNLPTAQTVTGSSPSNIVSASIPPAGTNMLPPASAPPVMQAMNPAVNAQDRNTELMALAMNNDTNSLNTIWSELANPDKEIRAGALAAVVQFGDHSVVPRLRELPAQTDDATEKAGILEAADFLELPSLTELHSATPSNAPPAR